MAFFDGMGLGQMSQYFRETEPWASDNKEVRKNFIMAIRAEMSGDHEKAAMRLEKAIAAETA